MSSRKRKANALTLVERMTSDFTDTLYTNMWQFMNPLVLKDIMASYGCRMTVKRRKGVSPNGKVFPVSQRNSLCHESYGAGPDAEGHYYYIDKDGRAHGTYENNLILKDIDDGICHGAALIYSLKACGMDLPDLIENPDNDKDLDHNYRTILSIYIDIIERGYWDKALKKHFENDSELTWHGETTLQTTTALAILKSYIKRFD